MTEDKNFQRSRTTVNDLLAILPSPARDIRTNHDTTAIAILGLGLVYLAVKEPLLISVILSASLFFYCLNQVICGVPYLKRYVGIKVRFWHIAAVIMAIAATLSLFETPAHAIFLNGLEQFITQIAQQSSTGGGRAAPKARSS